MTLFTEVSLTRALWSSFILAQRGLHPGRALTGDSQQVPASGQIPNSGYKTVEICLSS